jgi:hypothetical protein
MEFIMLYWPVIPTVIAVASVIAKITPNKTDDKVMGFVLKIVDALALTKGPTKP